VVPVGPGGQSGTSASRPAVVALGNSGYGVVASADSIIDLIMTFSPGAPQ